ncbi:MAG: TonB-dependent receptor [Verrucomicrobia bacterium]|nr:TonB-dependent receptor [Verrucomicrobiota bacterium]
MKTPCPLNRSLLVASVLLYATIVPARSAQGRRDSGDDSQPTLLPEFTVKGDGERGYLASESVTGTRVATAIRDLTFNVNVITGDFLDDFAFFEIDDDYGYTSSLNSFDQGGNYNLRGFNANNMRRDGFFRVGMMDKSNIDRIEVLKGPVAAAYGESAPSGLLNVVSKQPRSTPSRELKLYLGSYDTTRVEGNASGPVPGTTSTFYALNLAFYERTFDVEYKALRNKSISLALTHNLQPTAKLSLTIEHMVRGAQSNPDTIPYLWNGTTYLGLATGVPELRRFSHNGPNSYQNRTITSATGGYETRFAAGWSVRARGNWFHRTNQGHNTGSFTQYNPATRLLSGRGRPTFSLTGEDGGGALVDASRRAFLFGGKVESWTTLTLDYTTYWRFGRTVQLSRNNNTNPADPYYFKTSMSLDAIDYRVPAFDPVLYSSVTSWLHNRVDTIGSYARQQFAFFNRRLIVMASARYDTTQYNLLQRDTSTPVAGALAHYRLSQKSPVAGVNYKLAPGVAAYVNWSRAFDADSQGKRALSDRSMEHSNGFDYGFKSGFLEDRLQFTLGGFYTNRYDVAVTDVDPATGDTFTTQDGAYRSRGAEFDGTWRIGNGLMLLGSYAYVQSEQTDAGRDSDAVGRPPARQPKHQGSLAGKYSASGALRGFSCNWGGVYTGGSYLVTNTAGGIFDSRTRRYIGNNNQRNLTVGSSFRMDLGLRYQWKRSGLGHSLGLNVKNVLDREYVKSSRVFGDHRSWFASYALAFR